MQKKLLVALCAAAFTAGLSMNSFAADPVSETGSTSAKQITVKFKGKVINNPCEISTDIGPSSVRLGTYPVAYFDGNDTTKEVPFLLKIGKCRLTRTQTEYTEAKDGYVEVPANLVKLTFTDHGQHAGATRPNGLMGLTAPSEGAQSAQGIGIQVTYQARDKSFQNVFTDQDSSQINVSDMHFFLGEGSNEDGKSLFYTIRMKANMAKIGENAVVTAGDVNGEMNVSLSYE